TAALIKAAVTRLPPYRAAVSSLKRKRPRKEGKREKQRTRGLSGECGMLTHTPRAFPDPEHLAMRSVSSLGHLLHCSGSTVPYNFG
ncbi:hypothetical protein KI387_041553, partial [Taxus chinensis]